MLPDKGAVIVLVSRLTDCPIESEYGPVITPADTNVDVVATAAGAVTALASRVTAVWANSLPLIEAPVARLIAVWAIIIPSK
jgi:hypothetical protein